MSPIKPWMIAWVDRVRRDLEEEYADPESEYHNHEILRREIRRAEETGDAMQAAMEGSDGEA